MNATPDFDWTNIHPDNIFHVSSEAFDEFEAMLDAPPEYSPKLAELMARPTVFDQDA